MNLTKYYSREKFKLNKKCIENNRTMWDRLSKEILYIFNGKYID